MKKTIVASNYFITYLNINNMKNIKEELKTYCELHWWNMGSKTLSFKGELKDLLKVEDGAIALKANGSAVLLRGKEHRAISIIRTEVTKVANEGAKKQFKEGGVTNIRWVSSFGARTCPRCEDLNGEIFPIDDHPSIPLHGMCRCTLVPVTELG